MPNSDRGSERQMKNMIALDVEWKRGSKRQMEKAALNAKTEKVIALDVEWKRGFERQMEKEALNAKTEKVALNAKRKMW